MTDIVLSLRQRKIMHHLKYKNYYITGEELSKELGVSARTIRTDINEINQVLEGTGITILSKRSVGYLLQADDTQKISNILRINDSFLSRTERVRYIVYKLCLTEDEVNLYDLEDEMFISSTTLELDLQELRKKYIFDYPFIKMHKSKNAISFEKNELKRRFILNRIFEKNWDYDSTGNSFYNYKYVDEGIIHIVAKEIHKHLTEYRVELEDVNMVHFILAIAITYYRLLDGYPITEHFELSTNDKLSIHLVDDILDSLESKLDIVFPEMDREALYVFMASAKLLNATLLNFRSVKNFFDEDLIKLCDQYIQNIREDFNIDFSKDEDFYITILQLLRYFKMPFKYFNRMNMASSALRKQFLIEFEIAYSFQPLAKEFYGNYLNYTEIFYLVFCISGALAYYNRTLPKINTAILCHYNLPVSWNLKHSVLEKFSDFIEIQSLNPVYTKDTKDFQGIDLVLTTVNKNMTKSIPCDALHITPFFTEKDQQNLQQYIDSTRVEKLYNSSSLSVYDLLANARWCEKAACETFFEAIELLYKELKKDVNIDDSFFASIMQREANITFAYEPDLAIVYQVGDYDKTALSIMTMDHRIRYNDNKLRVIILAAISKHDGNTIFQILNKFYNSQLNLQGLRFLKEKEEILDYLKEYL